MRIWMLGWWAGLALVAGGAGPVGQPPELAAAVEAALPDRPGSAGGQVTVLREDPGGWAFGTAVRRAPAAPDRYPDGWLWVARSGPGGWRVALEGGPEFRELAGQTPVLSAGERAAMAELSGRDADAARGTAAPEAVAPEATDFRTGMRLPYAVGQAWRYTGGPHPMSGPTRSSIDLAGGDGRVRAARAGTAYTMCGSGTGWLRVVHDRGFATDYYHLEGAIAADGRPVAAGDVLGRIGTDVSCGGSATGPHVHFSLRRGGDYVDIDRYGFGKWSVRAGAQPYQGYARHGSTRVGVGGAMHNYGALGLTEGVVDTDGGSTLNRRAGPGTGHRVVGTVADGATVRIECSARGTSHTGRDGYTTNLWNRLSERAGEVGGGGWVSDAFLWTGTGEPVSGGCGG